MKDGFDFFVLNIVFYEVDIFFMCLKSIVDRGWC